MKKFWAYQQPCLGSQLLTLISANRRSVGRSVLNHARKTCRAKYALTSSPRQPYASSQNIFALVADNALESVHSKQLRSSTCLKVLNSKLLTVMELTRLNFIVSRRPGQAKCSVQWALMVQANRLRLKFLVAIYVRTWDNSKTHQIGKQS